MIRIKNQESRIKLICLLSLILTALFLPLAVHAVDSTPSAEIQSKLEELKREIASKAAKFKQQVSEKLQNKAYVGKVVEKSQNSLTLTTRKGSKIVTINQDTIFESQIKSKQKFSQKTLAEGDFASALGDVDETGVLTAKKIILLTDSRLKTHLWGKIISISDRLITLKSREDKNVAITLPLPVKINDFVILTGSKNKNDIFEAEFVYIIPQGGILKPKKMVSPAPIGAGATPSAQISTKSATPKPATR